MFVVYHSHNPEFFKSIMIDVMSEQLLSDPMAPEIILVENKILEEWLRIELAKYFGISANIEFMSVASFIKKIYNFFFPNNFLKSDFNHFSMYWKFLEILSKKYLIKNFVIRTYLRNDVNKKKCGQLAEQLVWLFNKYLIYRPDWLDLWESNKQINGLPEIHQSWQSEIWRVFLSYMKFNNPILRFNLEYLKNCICLLENLKKNALFLDRVFIFGVTNIPPLYWTILELLSRHINIYVWFITPYCYNWQSYVNTNVKKYMYKELNFKLSVTSNINNYNTVNHVFLNRISPICAVLNKWGNIGIGTSFFFNIFKNIFEIQNLCLLKEDSVLHVLQKYIFLAQKDVLELDSKKRIIFKRHILALTDRSITYHICYNIQREVEILYDNLLLMIENDPSLLQKGIIVMAPDICCYTEAIHTVFNNMYRSLPFIISDDYDQYTHPIVSQIFNILSISCSRFTSEEVFSFLRMSHISSKFNLQQTEVELLYKWSIEVGIRWGLDDVTLRNLKFPITNQNTWYFGLNRMLLGYAINNEYDIWKTILPYGKINFEHIQIIGQLGEFLKILRKWRNKLNRSYSLIEWMPILEEVINDFFDYSGLTLKEKKIFSSLKIYWKKILMAGIHVEYSENINIIVLKDKLLSQFKLNKKKNRKFQVDAVNFCNITPTCCIPCKVICFLGMNDSVFPRYQIESSFDLMKQNIRNGDHNIYDADCYSFLLAFLLAQDYIYISFIETLCDDSINAPSMLVEELLEYIAQYFYIIGDENLDININRKRIRNHLFKKYSQMPFSSENFINGNKYQSFFVEWVSTAKINAYLHNLNCLLSNNTFVTLLPKIEISEILFDDLYNFYCHPVRRWFQSRLGVFFEQKFLNIIDSNNESFSIDRLNLFKLNTQLVNYFIQDKNKINDLYHKFCAAGILPYGKFGELCWAKQYQEMKIFSDQIKKYYFSEKYSLDISLKLKDITLIGQLIMVQQNGLVRWKPANICMKDGMLLWLEHLVYCSVGGTKDSRLLGINGTWHFPNFPKFLARKLLFFLISGYCIGMNTPLLLLYKSGGAWMNKVFDWKSKEISTEISIRNDGYHKVIRAWKGCSQNAVFKKIGECDDPYLRKIISSSLNTDEIYNITTTAERYFFYPMKYKILE